MIALLQELPKQMKAAQGKNYGDIDEMLTVEESVRVPNLKKEDDDEALFESSAKANGINSMIKKSNKS